MAKRKFPYKSNNIVGGFYGDNIQAEIINNKDYGDEGRFVNLSFVYSHNEGLDGTRWMSLKSPEEIDNLITTLTYYRDVVDAEKDK